MVGNDNPVFCVSAAEVIGPDHEAHQQELYGVIEPGSSPATAGAARR